MKGLWVLSMLFGEGGVFFYCFDVLLFFPKLSRVLQRFFLILYVLSAMNIDQIVKNPGLFMGERINVPTYCTQMSNSRKVLQNQIHTAHHEVFILAFLSPWMLRNVLSIFSDWLTSITQPMNDPPPIFDVLGWMASDFFLSNYCYFFIVFCPHRPPSSLSSDWWQRHWGRNSDVD